MAESLNAKLDRIEAKLDQLLARRPTVRPNGFKSRKGTADQARPPAAWMEKLGRILKGCWPGHPFMDCWASGMTPEQAFNEWKESVTPEEFEQWKKDANRG